jgi:hypothetical protein
MSRKSPKPPSPHREQKQRNNGRAIDILLLSIIRRNRHTASNEVRLARVKEFLLGEKNMRRGRKSISDQVMLYPVIEEIYKNDADATLRAFLKSMPMRAKIEAEEYLERPEKSLRSIALSFAKGDVGSETNETAIVDRIRKFAKNANYNRSDISDMSGLYHRNSPNSKRILLILEILRKLGIDCEYAVQENSHN